MQCASFLSLTKTGFKSVQKLPPCAHACFVYSTKKQQNNFLLHNFRKCFHLHNFFIIVQSPIIVFISTYHNLIIFNFAVGNYPVCTCNALNTHTHKQDASERKVRAPRAAIATAQFELKTQPSDTTANAKVVR